MDKLPHDAGFRYPEPQLQVDSLPVKELIYQLFGIIRRQYPLIAVISACVIAFALVYLFTTPKLYTAHAQFLIDTTKMRIVQQQQQAFGEVPLDTAQVETQIEVLKSEGVGLAVVKDLKLTVLNCQNTQVKDLTPLKSMSVQQLWCDFKPERDTELLRSIKKLERINDKPAKEVLK